MLFTCIKLWFLWNHFANFHQISHWSFCWNVIDSLYKWSCSIDCQAHIFFFKTKNCSNDDIFISCDDRIGKMLHNICMSAVAMSLRWANRGLWASCFYLFFVNFFLKYKKKCFILISLIFTNSYRISYSGSHKDDIPAVYIQTATDYSRITNERSESLWWRCHRACCQESCCCIRRCKTSLGHLQAIYRDSRITIRW